MKNNKDGILSKISTLKINSNKLNTKNNIQKYTTPRQSKIIKEQINTNTSTKIRVNIISNEENINSNNFQRRLRKSKSKPKYIIKKDSKKNFLTVNKSFNNKTVKNKNKKNETNLNATVNTFFTSQNDNKYLNTETNNNIRKKIFVKNKTIKKRKSFGYNNWENSTNIDDISKKNNTMTMSMKTENSHIKKTKSNTNIKINLNKNLNSAINNIKIKKVESKTKSNIEDKKEKNRIRASKSAKKLIIRKEKMKEDKSKISKERHSMNEFNIKINKDSKINQIRSPTKSNKKIKNTINNSEYKKNNSLNLFNNNNKKINKNVNISNDKNNKNANNIRKKSNKKVLTNKINNNLERKSINVPSQNLLNKEENNINKKPLNKNKSSKNFKSSINNNKINHKQKPKKIKRNKEENIEKEQSIENNNLKTMENKVNDEYLTKIDNNKNNKENINSLNISPKTSSNRLNKTNKIKLESDFDEIKKTPLLKKSLSKKVKIIINFDDLIEFDSKLDSIITSLSSLSSLSNDEKILIPNDCSEFFSFYFHSSLNNIFSDFFSKKNKIIITSANNLLFFSVMVLYHLSLNQKMLMNLLDDMKYIFSLLKINFFFLVKKIEFYYKDDFPLKCSDLFNQKFVQYISINCSNEIDLISKINKNCCNISERMKLIINYYERNNDRYYDEFSGIFKNLSRLEEKDINSYFFGYLYINPFNSEINKINEVNNININYANKKSIKQKNTNSENGPLNSDNESDNYLSDNFSMSYKSDKDDNERELLSVKSYKSSNYFGKLKSDNIQDTTTINCDNNFYYNIENNIYENDEDGTNAYEIMKMIKDYEINRVSPPFIFSKTKKRYTLILDLDETLIHLRQKKQVVNIKNDVNININNTSDYNYNSDKDKNKYLLQFRVGLFSFLTLLKPFYEIISFTSASREYADVIINEIEKKRKFFDYKFYREHCTIYKDTFVKDISKIGRDLQKIIIVDNNENNFVLNKENGIKISAYYGDDEHNTNNNINKKNDNALLELKKILIMIYKDNYDDIREALKDYEELIKNKVSLES